MIMPFYNPLLQEYSIPLFFSTSTILNWKPLLKPNGNKDIIISSLEHLVDRKRINLYGFVVMPTHIHSIFSLCEGNLLKDVQRDFGKYTAQQLKLNIHLDDMFSIEEFNSTQIDRNYQIWERRPLSIPIYNDKPFYQKLIIFIKILVRANGTLRIRLRNIDIVVQNFMKPELMIGDF